MVGYVQQDACIRLWMRLGIQLSNWLRTRQWIQLLSWLRIWLKMQTRSVVDTDHGKPPSDIQLCTRLWKHMWMRLWKRLFRFKNPHPSHLMTPPNAKVAPGTGDKPCTLHPNIYIFSTWAAADFVAAAIWPSARANAVRTSALPSSTPVSPSPTASAHSCPPLAHKAAPPHTATAESTSAPQHLRREAHVTATATATASAQDGTSHSHSHSHSVCAR